MSQKDKFLSTYVKMLEKQREITEKFQVEFDKIELAKSKLAKHLVEEEFEEVPDIICEDASYVAWQIGVQNDAYAIRLYRVLRDKVSGNNRGAKDFEAEQNLFKEKIGGWLLNALNKSGANSVNCGEAGKAYKKLKIRANAVDWDAFLRWAAENEAADAVQKRINSSFIKKYEEEHGELPPYVDVFKEFDVVVTK
jgi:hypothetical protein